MLHQYVEQFLSYCQIAGFSERSLRTLAARLKEFNVFIKSKSFSHGSTSLINRASVCPSAGDVKSYRHYGRPPVHSFPRVRSDNTFQAIRSAPPHLTVGIKSLVVCHLVRQSSLDPL